MNRLASLVLMLSILAALALPALQPTYSAFAQADGSVVSDPPVEETPTEIPIPTEVPPSETPVPPPPVATNTEVAAPSVEPSIEASATDPAVEPAAPTATPFKNLNVGDRFVTTTAVNCRVGPSTGMAIVKTVVSGSSGVVIEQPQRVNGYDWMKVQLLDAQTTQCYLAAQYVTLTTPGYGIPPTITPTPSITPTSSRTPVASRTPTRTRTPSATPSSTATGTNTATQTATLTGSETATATATITETPTETSTPTITNTPTKTSVATLTSTPTYRNIHAGDLVGANQAVNCRTATSMQATVARILARNDQAVVTVDPVNVSGTYWAKVRPLGLSTECFVSAQYLDVVQSGGGLTPTVPGTVTTGPYKVGDIIVTTATVNLRTDAGTNNPIVRSISSNTTGTVMAGYKKVGSDDWVQVQFPTGNGWVAARYTRLVTSSTPGGPYAAGEKVVATSIVNLRIAPGTTSTALAQLQIGEQGIALGAQATVGTTIWVQVEFPAGSGWVSAAYLKRLTAVTPTPAPSTSNVAVYLDCTSNPERVLVTNNNPGSIRIISIGSTYQPIAGEPFAVDDTIGSKVTFSYLSNSNASGAFRLTNQEIFSDSAGSQEGVVVKTSVGDVTASCAAATTGEKWIEVNLSTQTMTVWRGSSKVSSSLVSTGKPGFETPTGTFYISTKYTSVTMTGCAGGECWSVPAVPWAMLFRSGGYFIHGAYWHNQFGISRLSHGCVNLPVPYAEWLYGWAPSGTRVWIHY